MQFRTKGSHTRFSTPSDKEPSFGSGDGNLTQEVHSATSLVARTASQGEGFEDRGCPAEHRPFPHGAVLGVWVPPRPRLQLGEEDWECHADPFAISRNAPVASPWGVWTLTLVSFSALVIIGLSIPLTIPKAWFSPRREGVNSVAIQLEEPAKVPFLREDGLQRNPGGGHKSPQKAPVATPGIGGMGDIDALPMVKNYADTGEFSTPLLPLASVTALGGGLNPRLGVGGGAPWGVASGVGGGRGGGGQVRRPNPSVSVANLIPIRIVHPHYFVAEGFTTLPDFILRVRVTVQMDGSTTNAEFTEGDPMYREKAIEAALQWRFKPLLACGFNEPQVAGLVFHSRLFRKK